MVQKIIRLSESVINQIAAGEVIENPASIVKELLENSLDAGAKNIAVSIRKGGQLSIEIEDDGVGMGPEDALLSLERHATSKIRSADDLFSLTTMGFRGEALAAISSVSRFELKTSDGSIGTSIQAEGGVIEKISPCARNRGTTILVRDLFFNTPARQKFLKSVASCTSQITRLIETISLAHSEISFDFTADGEKIYRLPSSSKRERIEQIFGPFQHAAENSTLWGLFGAPYEAKSHRRGQMIFINKRPVFSPLISKAVQTGYSTRLKENQYPPFVLFIDIDPKDVDVNVHPQKKEVRLSKESSLFQSVEKLVSEMFLSKEEGVHFSGPKPIFFESRPSFLFPENPSPFPTREIAQELPIEVKERGLHVSGRFLILEKEGVYLVDLAKARSRVMFESLRQTKGESQPLLWPLEMEIEDFEIIDRIKEFGVECRLLRGKKIAVDAIPSEIEVSEFPLFLNAFEEGKTVEAASVRFCRTSHKNYTLDEAMNLWQKLQKCKDTLYDPSGKRIWVKLEPKDLEKWIALGSIG